MEGLTVAELATALVALGPEVQDYEVWIEADPSMPVYRDDISVDHENRRVLM